MLKNSNPILLVEDNPQDELLELRAFKTVHIGNRIDVVRDGAQALDYLFRRGEFSDLIGEALPVVVVLDIGLPKLSGLEVLRKVRADERTRLQPIVILTSSDEERDLIASFELGANSYVRKPLDSAQFTQAVARLGVYWVAVNESPSSLHE